MTLQRLLLTVAAPALLVLNASTVLAQVTISDDLTTPVNTSTAGEGGTPSDVTIDSNGSVTLSTSGTAVTLDSDSTLINSGAISSNDVDNVTGVEIQGGNTGSFSNAGSISMVESFTGTDTDDDRVVDGDFAEGTGRTGILISGASPFVGNVIQTSAGRIEIEGNDSFGIRLAQPSTLTGDMDLNGAFSIVGTNAVAVGVEGQIIGDLASGAAISARGENSKAISVTGQIDGQLRNNGQITNTGYRFGSRPTSDVRDLLGPEDLLQAGSAISVNGNISNGIFLRRVLSSTTNETTGVVTTSVASQSSISQFGEAAAILIDGQGTPIAIGVVGTVTDPTDADYDADLLYAFVQQGSITSAGIYNDINATAFYVSDATLTGGINNEGSMTASTFRSGDSGTADAAGDVGNARVIVLGDNAIAERINNSGIILAQVSEASDEIYADLDNIIPARFLTATAIDISATANLPTLTNTGSISALITGRNGDVIAIRDSSGTLTEINNSGQIQAAGRTSDIVDEETTTFNVIAIDVSTNTTGVTIRQTAPIDADTTDSVIPAPAAILGQVLLGSGNDFVDIQSGTLTGDLKFGAGADQFSLSGGSAFSGVLNDSDGDLIVSVTDGSSLTHTSTDIINVTSATIDSTSTFSPTINGDANVVSTLVASNSVVLEDGASVVPILSNVVGIANQSFEVIKAANLDIQGSLAGLSTAATPFLYNTTYSIDPSDANTLLVTLDLRTTSELGLDNVQTATFASAFEALENNASLANALINITDGNEFNQAYNQLLPEFAAAGRQYILANVDGATGAVGSHLDTTRRSPDRPGGVWIEEFAYFADRELAGLSEQYRGYGFGFMAGMDKAIGPFHAVGVNLGFASTEIEDVIGQDDPLDIVTLQGGLYAGYATGNLGVDAYIGGGYNDFESRRMVEINDYNASADGDWSGTHYNASLKAGYDVKFSDKYWARPVVSVDYLSLTEQGYTESGDSGIALDIDKRTVEVGSATAMLNLGARFMGKRTWIRPSIRAGYRTEFMNDPVITSGRFAGFNTPFTITGEDFPDDGFLLGFTVAAGSKYSSFAFDYDSDIRDGFIRHTGRIVFRLLF